MKTGIVFEGGASRTAYSCGVMDCLLDNEIFLDYVIGVSAGIAFGISYSSRQVGRNKCIFAEFMHDPRYMGIKHFLGKKKSYYNFDFAFEEMPEKYLPYDWEAYSNYGENAKAVITNIETGLPEYYPVTCEDKKWTLLKASSSLPILFPPVKLYGGVYMDGGITDSIPFERAFEDGCDKVIVVLTRERGFVKKPESLLPLIRMKYKKYPKLIKALENRHIMYNEQLRKLYELEKSGKVMIIAPKDTHGISRTERKTEILVPYFEEGYNDTEKIIDKIRNFIN